MWASVVAARGLNSCGSQSLEYRLNSCGAEAYLLHCIWDLPGSGIEPVSPALAGRFSTTEPLGKPCRPALNQATYLECSTNIFFHLLSLQFIPSTLKYVCPDKTNFLEK